MDAVRPIFRDQHETQSLLPTKPRSILTIDESNIQRPTRKRPIRKRSIRLPISTANKRPIFRDQHESQSLLPTKPRSILTIDESNIQRPTRKRPIRKRSIRLPISTANKGPIIFRDQHESQSLRPTKPRSILLIRQYPRYKMKTSRHFAIFL